MSDRIAVFNEGGIEQVGAAGRGLRAARQRLRRRLRRRLERARARRHGGSRSARRRSASSTRATAADGLHTRDAGRSRDVAYAGMITRYLVELDAGGELQVVRQNLETTSAGGARGAAGRKVTVGWRAEHTVAVRETERGEQQ